jgi:predicted amidophosphoribosyltransferase
MGKRLSRECASIEKMITIYCKAKHKTGNGLCGDCSDLLEYARQRLQHCRFSEEKPVCAKCLVHCYRKTMREKIIAVMRYSGPKMIYKHPALALLHLFDSYRSTPIDLNK